MKKPKELSQWSLNKKRKSLKKIKEDRLKMKATLFAPKSTVKVDSNIPNTDLENPGKSKRKIAEYGRTQTAKSIEKGHWCYLDKKKTS